MTNLLDKINLDEIIEREYKKAIKCLRKFRIIEYIKRKYGIDYKIPELEIVDYDPSIVGKYLPLENKIIISKKSIEREINNYLKFLGYKKRSILLCPFYVNKRNIRKAIARVIILSTMFHEFWHSIDLNILNKLKNDSTIKDRDYLIAILNNRNNLEVRASVFQAVMDCLVNGFYKDEKGYMAAYKNIPECRKYIKKIDKLKNNVYENIIYPYKLGFCYGNIIVAKYKSSLAENIQDIIKDLIYLDEKRVIDTIKLYGDNLKKRLYG